MKYRVNPGSKTEAAPSPGRPFFTGAWREPRVWVSGLVLALVVFAVHSRDLGNGFVYDDEDNIVENPN